MMTDWSCREGRHRSHYAVTVTKAVRGRALTRLGMQVVVLTGQAVTGAVGA